MKKRLWGTVIGATMSLLLISMAIGCNQNAAELGGAPCEEDRDCRGDEICVDDTCELDDRDDCDRDRDCDDEEYCHDREYCRAYCSRDSDCYSDEYCASDDMCYDDNRGGSSRECDRDSDCDYDEYCTSHGSCRYDSSYNDDCRSNSDCASDEYCNGGRCYDDRSNNDRCDRDRDCGSGYYCSGGECYEYDDRDSCSRDSDCRSGYECYQGYCERERSGGGGGGRTGIGTYGDSSDSLEIYSEGTGASWDRICVDGEYLESCSGYEELNWRERLGCVDNYSGIRAYFEPPRGTCAFRFQVELCNARVSNPRADYHQDWDCVWLYEGHEERYGNRTQRFGARAEYNGRNLSIRGVDIVYYDEYYRDDIFSSSGYVNWGR